MVSVIIAYIVDAFVFKIESISKRKHCEIHGEIYDCNCHESEESGKKRMGEFEREKQREIIQSVGIRRQKCANRKLEIAFSSLKDMHFGRKFNLMHLCLSDWEKQSIECINLCLDRVP